MSNRIDFLGAEQGQMAIPAGRPLVFLDGQFCPFLEVAEIVRAANPEFGWAKLVYNTTAYEGGDIVSGERIETIAAMGRRISIRQIYDVGIGETRPEAINLFHGQIERIDRELGADGDVVEITAKDYGALVGRITVYGRRVDTGGGDTKFLESMELVFNKDDKPNASKEKVEHEGKSYTVFEADSEQAKYWSYAEIIHYLLSEHLYVGQLQVPSLAQLEAVTNNHISSEVDVEGLSLAKAIEKCCGQVGIRFKFVPRQSENGPGCAILFYRPGVGRQVELNCQWPGETLSISRTNVSQVENRKNFWPVTQQYIGRGDFKVFEATFDLIKAWDPGLEGGQRADYSPSTEGFDDVRDVYRKWCLNEAGDYRSAPYNQGDAFDFSWIFETDGYVQRRRKFINAISTDSSGDSLGDYVEVSYDSGSTWQEHTEDFDVLDDQCGIWLSSDEFSDSVWNAAVAGTLRFRITAAVESDERLSCVVADGPVNSVVDVVDHVIDKSSQFKFRKVSGKSVFHNSTADNIGVADEADDTEALMEYVRRIAESSLNIIETIEVQTPMVAMAYEVGDRVVSGPESRDILGIRLDGRSVFWIDRAMMDFQKQCMCLKVLRRRG